MKFNLTDHAKKRCLRRKIKNEWIGMTLENYLRIESDEEDESLKHVFWPVPEKGYKLLRVIYNETTDPVNVVTAYFEAEVIEP